MADALILYVDDDWSNRVVFERSFAPEFRVKTVGSGEDALAVLEKEEVGVLVTDQRMPGMSGNQLLMAAKERWPSIVRIVITAYGDLDPILRAVNEGLVARYIIKPWEKTELERVLAWAVETFERGRTESAVQLRLLQTERLATIGSLASALFHDLGNVLAHTRNNIQRLQELAAASPALARLLEEQEADGLSARECELLADLAEELPELASDLGYSAEVMEGIAASRRILQAETGSRETVEPRGVIEYVLSLFRGGRVSLSLGYDGPPTLPRVPLSMSELSQILLNLVSNALNAIGDRGGRVTITGSAADASVRLAVSDDGAGMSPDVLAKAGSLFFSTRPDGTGLGLAQCRRLVERAGGQLDIRSAEGKGTTVTVELPRA